jgi:adenine C2-methylase RlmN of 23S rRNA A2503 and tRNA A37
MQRRAGGIAMHRNDALRTPLADQPQASDPSARGLLDLSRQVNGRNITFEYVMLDGINDGGGGELARLLQGRRPR